MNQDFFKHLPSDIMTNILSRLPIQSIAISKCVCKPWLHLLETDEFVNSHLAKSIATLAVLTPETDSSSCMIFEFEDEHDLESHHLHYHQLTKFDFPHSVEIYGSADHLLLLSNLSNRPEQTHYVCNPITREYVELRFPKELISPYRKVVNYPDTLEESVYAYPPSFTCGFGASRLTGKYKVVLISHDSIIVHKGETPRRIIPKPDCHVYTLGTGSWRRVEAVPPFEYNNRPSSVFLNGCLHWIVFDSNEKLWISCFDLETECFGTFPAPPLCYQDCGLMGALSILGDCLCFCDHTGEDETVIWLMKEYGVEKSWTKEYVMNINESDLDIEGFELVYPLKVFEDGDILILRDDYHLFYYSMKTRTAREIDIFTAFHPTNSIILTPSFRSLKSFEIENVVKI